MQLTLVLTHACNLRCTYCYTGEKKSVHMTPATAARALDLAFATAKAPIQVSFFGGEPLLAWDVLSATAKLARARSAASGVPVVLQVTTNGTLLTRARADRLRALGVYVTLSIDGVRPAQDATRPGADGRSSHDATRRALALLLAAKEPFSTILVIDPATVRHLAAGVRELLDLGVDHVVLNPHWAGGWSDADLAVWEGAYEQIAALRLAWGRRGRVVTIAPLDTAIAAGIKGWRDEGDRCSPGVRSVAVAPSGRLYGCGRLVGEDDGRHAIGDLATGLARSAPRSAPGAPGAPGDCGAPDARDACSGCDALRRCDRQCACACAEETGDPTIPGPVLCWHQHLVERLAGRLRAAEARDAHPLRGADHA